MINLPVLPKSIQDLSYDGIMDGLNKLNEMKAYVAKPRRPPINHHPTSAELLALAELQADYERKLVEYEEHKKQAGLHNMKVETLMNALVASVAGLDLVPEQYRSKVYSKAWSTGSSSGHYAVYQELVELVEIFKA